VSRDAQTEPDRREAGSKVWGSLEPDSVDNQAKSVGSRQRGHKKRQGRETQIYPETPM
jgi:hypothetical protein